MELQYLVVQVRLNLISISEKISLLNELSKSKYKEKYLIGTGLNSLNETINLMKISISLNFNVLFKYATCLLQVWRQRGD